MMPATVMIMVVYGLMTDESAFVLIRGEASMKTSLLESSKSTERFAMASQTSAHTTKHVRVQDM